ncbi:MAG: hypothetical protein ACXABD_01505 [Candidatus Thorarchaeota archaeon]|jgi:hypothetical protein
MPCPNRSQVALCIPRVEDGITETFVREIFTSLNIGAIKSIVICKANKVNGRKAFINLTSWNTSDVAKKIKYRLTNDLSVNIMYQIPWYWKLKLAYAN